MQRHMSQCLAAGWPVAFLYNQEQLSNREIEREREREREMAGEQNERKSVSVKFAKHTTNNRESATSLQVVCKGTYLNMAVPKGSLQWCHSMLVYSLGRESEQRSSKIK